MADFPPELDPSAEKMEQIMQWRIPKRRTLLPDEVDPPTDAPTVSADTSAAVQAMEATTSTDKADKSVFVTDEEQPAKFPAVESSVASKPTSAMAAGRSYAQRKSPKTRVRHSARPPIGSRRALYPPREFNAVRFNTPWLPLPPSVLPGEESDWEADNDI